jgi:membrane protein
MKTLKNLIPIVKQVFHDVGDKNMSLTAAGVAFFCLFSLFPSLAALIALLGLLFDPNTVVTQMEPLKTVFPEDVYYIIYDQIFKIASAQNEKLSLTGLFGLALAMWSARAGVSAMMRGLNVVYYAKNRNIFRHYIKALTLTVVLIILTSVGFFATIVLPIITSYLKIVYLEDGMVTFFRWSIGTLVLFMGISMLQRYGPNRSRESVGWIMPGAIFSTLGAVMASIALSQYIKHFNSYNEAYGSLGAVIALLMWFYLISMLVLIGGSLNCHIDEQKNQK